MATNSCGFRGLNVIFTKFSVSRSAVLLLQPCKQRIQCTRLMVSKSKPLPDPKTKRRLMLFGLGAVTGLTFHSLPTFSRWFYKDNVTDIVPKVDAAGIDTGSTSRRNQMNFVADVVEVASPAVVYIEIQGMHPFTGKQTAVSNGSGFIVRSDGLVLTNAHVVANKSNVKVKLHDGRLLDGYVQAVDRVSDLATVKLNASDLPTLKLGKSSELRPGEWVVAMGSPFQLSNTVTCGIVSSVNRGSKELGLAKDMDYIQTDATINFGNSGGPLINLDGEAIGINTMKVTTGISFAIPSDYARQFLEKAEKIEKRSDSKGWFGGSSKASPPVNTTTRRYMGITMLTLTPNIAQELRVRYGDQFPADVQVGVLIHRVIVESPAYNAGITPGDILTHINGKEVKSSSDVYRAVDRDTELQLTVRRGPNKVVVTVKPEDV